MAQGQPRFAGRAWRREGAEKGRGSRALASGVAGATRARPARGHGGVRRGCGGRIEAEGKRRTDDGSPPLQGNVGEARRSRG